MATAQMTIAMVPSMRLAVDISTWYQDSDNDGLAHLYTQERGSPTDMWPYLAIATTQATPSIPAKLKSVMGLIKTAMVNSTKAYPSMLGTLMAMVTVMAQVHLFKRVLLTTMSRFLGIATIPVMTLILGRLKSAMAPTKIAAV